MYLFPLYTYLPHGFVYIDSVHLYGYPSHTEGPIQWTRPVDCKDGDNNNDNNARAALIPQSSSYINGNRSENGDLDADTYSRPL